jgi:hypothetical protein
MRALEIHLNGEKLCTAGIGDDGVLSAIVNWVTGKSGADLHLYVGGLINPGKERVSWVEHRHLTAGDEIQVKVVEVNSVDEPMRRTLDETAKALEDRKEYVRRMAKQLGLKIQEGSTEPRS